MPTYVRKPELPKTVEAIQLKKAISVFTPYADLGVEKGEPGDYLVTDGDRQYIVKKKDFEARYQLQRDHITAPQLGPEPFRGWLIPATGPDIVYCNADGCWPA
jgi:hypothetical protein